MAEIISFNRKRVFTLEQAKDLLPVVRRVTHTAWSEVKVLSAQFSYTNDQAKRKTLEEELKKVFHDWQGKIQKLGCEAKGLWLVDFDTGDGYYCWHYPEPEVAYFHGYDDGFSGRKKIH